LTWASFSRLKFFLTRKSCQNDNLFDEKNYRRIARNRFFFLWIHINHNLNSTSKIKLLRKNYLYPDSPIFHPLWSEFGPRSACCCTCVEIPRLEKNEIKDCFLEYLIASTDLTDKICYAFNIPQLSPSDIV